MSSKRVLATSIAGIALTTLALSACEGGNNSPGESASGEQDDPQAEIYQFDDLLADSSPEPYVANSDALTVQLSDGLRQALPSGVAVMVDKFSLQSKTFGTGYCRLDVKIDYADGGKEALQQPSEDESDTVANQGDDVIAERLFRGDSSVDEYVDQPPADEDLKDSTTYMTKDLTQITDVDKCGDNPGDHLLKLAFPYNNLPEGSENDDVDAFAEVKAGAMAEGQEGTIITLTDPYTDADQGVGGNWEQPEG